MHISCVRGSPLIRTVLVLLALVASGFGFVRLTSQSMMLADDGVPVMLAEKEELLIPAKVRLILSRPAGFFELKIGERTVNLKHGDPWELSKKSWEFTGEAMIDPDSPVVFLKVACVPPASGDTAPVFAKLVVEAEGKKTFTHVFDAPGDIDDFVELPF